MLGIIETEYMFAYPAFTYMHYYYIAVVKVSHDSLERQKVYILIFSIHTNKSNNKHP